MSIPYPLITYITQSLSVSHLPNDGKEEVVIKKNTKPTKKTKAKTKQNNGRQ